MNYFDKAPKALIRAFKKQYPDLQPQTFNQWLTPSLSDLKDPYRLSGMKKSVERIHEAYTKDEKICIYGDFDLDGSSATALLYDALKQFGFKHVEYLQARRLKDGYGFHAHFVTDLHERDVSLIISVDVGINAFDAVNRANELGVDVIITDHHLPDTTLPDAFAIINPNSGVCESGMGQLCGAGVAFYLSLGILKTWKLLNYKVDFNPKELLDLFIIGTLTDLVPLIDENRTLVKHGLKIFERTQRPGLKALKAALKLNKSPLSSSDIAIRLAPKLNALSRLDTDIKPIDIMLCDDRHIAKDLVDRVLDFNGERIKLQRAAEIQAFEMAFEHDDDFHLICSEEFHKGVIGLIATSLAQRTELPSFVGSIKAGVISGSARLPKLSQYNLVDMMSQCGALSQSGGHSQAAGFSLELKNLELFREQLKKAIPQSTEILKPDIKTLIHTTAKLSELDENYLKWCDRLEPFGVGFELPVYLIEDVQISGFKELKGGHLRLNLQQNSHVSNGIWFGPRISPGELDKILNKNSETSFNIALRPEWNDFAGVRRVQMMVQDLEILDQK